MPEFKKRFAAAKAHRAERIDLDGWEVYKFIFNGREAEWSGKGYTQNTTEEEEIFASIVAGVAEEFSGEMFSTMTPENSPWVEYEAGSAIPEDVEDQAMQVIKSREVAIDKAIRGSNYYDEGPTAFHDVNLGTVAIWADRYHLSDPITFEAVPASELFLRLGPRGLEDRFRRKKYFWSDLPTLFPEADFPREIKQSIKKSNGRVEVVWGFWRDYSDVANPIWKQAIRVDNKPVGLDKDLGPEGACPLIAGRFNAVPNSAWGRGPAIRMLPDIRVYNELVRMNLENMDKNLDPAFAYPHDGMLDLSDGIENGLGYPAMPGSAQEIVPIGTGGNLDYGFFAEGKIREAIRDGFFREIEQRGKTPPSASQYMGQEQKQIRRMARPAGKLWREFGVGVLKRVEYLETQPGGSLVDQPALLLEGQVVTLRPISPLERAQAREEVLTAQSIMGMAQEALGPEQAGMVIDGPKTMSKVKEVLKDRIVEFRTEEQIAKIMQQMQPQPQADPNAQTQG